jgi:hypothetical protein
MRPEGNWVNGQDRLAQQRKILNTVIRPAPQWGANASGMLPNRHGRAEVPGPDPGTSARRWRLGGRRCVAISVTEIAEKRKATEDHSAAPPGDESTLAAAARRRSSGGCRLRAPRTK